MSYKSQETSDYYSVRLRYRVIIFWYTEKVSEDRSWVGNSLYFLYKIKRRTTVKTE